ncbi:putative Ig domain-containing protein [Leptospira ryugenii]|uniref:putative Ig domain-containing protein n=1 Tax=Leptospira ryugenii TaxID=1917863 RepID=UPI00143544EC
MSQPRTTYTLTANTTAGSQTTTFDITINPSPPTFVSAIFSTYVIGVSTSVSIVKGGCVPCTFSISPALPAGLSLDSSTGVISGTPTTAQSATTYSVTASNSAGSITSNSTSLTIVPVSIVYSGQFLYYPVSTSVSITPTTTSASAVTYSLTSGSLPAGISLNTSTGAITGTTPGTASTNSITIRGTNSAGNANSNLLSFRVHTVADLTCNTSGTASGCSVSTPFSCNASSLCYGSLSTCRQSAPTGSCQY